MSTSGEARVPQEFAAALESIRATRVRPDVALREIPAPSRIAPYALALAGELAGPRAGPRADDPEAAATGRFVVLYDPAGQDVWEGRFRVVSLVRATLEPDLARDPLLPEVAWTWLRESLERAGAASRASGGTVTRVISESFGSLVGRPEADEVEIRASWTPPGADLGPHLHAWTHLLGAAAGRPPLPEGVTPLRSRRGGGA